jgi:hypothetical protein
VYIHSPPTDRFIEVADLVKAVRKQSGDKISIVKINYDGYNNKCTWKADCLQLPDLDSAATYYYVPLVGFAGSTKAGKDLDIKQVYGLMKQSHIAKLQECSVYGVRAADIKTVQGLPNWIQLDVLVEEVLNDFKANDFLGVVLSSIESDKVDLYYNAEIMATIDPKSPLRVLHDKLPKTPAHGNRQIFELATLFDSDHNLKEMEAEAISEITSLRSRYPMFNLIRSRNFDDPACIEYIQLVDKQRGLN